MKKITSILFFLTGLILVLSTAYPVYSQKVLVHPPARRGAVNVPEIIAKIQPSVVNIKTNHRWQWHDEGGNWFIVRFFQDFFEQRENTYEIKFHGTGTGVILDSSGLILTNEHVIAGAPSIQVVLHGGKTYPAQLIGKNRKEDLALIQIEATEPLQPIALGDSDALQVGEDVFAIGTPYEYAWTVTRGIVSGLHRKYPEGKQAIFDDLIQTDASVNPGNSGGPLLNMKGEMIGLINLQIWRAQGIGFAIPVNRAKNRIPELKAWREKNAKLEAFMKRFGFFPVEAKGPDGQEKVVVVEVDPDSDVGAVGLRAGDTLTQFQKTKIRFVEDLIEEGAKVKEGERLYLEIGRGKQFFFTYLKAK
ncbi:MAG: trypsin-like peptidase domain-containing protein [Candidatus Omnitrophica bacterium]|nr:trypsin-like peptidase domain-containing protein [Candidatus Omnitrophota bacterium]